VGHDRGGGVAWRLATEHPERVTRTVILDIVPTPYASVTREFATAYFHWFFLVQPAWMVLADALIVVVVGLLMGMAAATATSRLIETLLVGLSVSDPAAYALMIAVCWRHRC